MISEGCAPRQVNADPDGHSGESNHRRNSAGILVVVASPLVPGRPRATDVATTPFSLPEGEVVSIIVLLILFTIKVIRLGGMEPLTKMPESALGSG